MSWRVSGKSRRTAVAKTWEQERRISSGGGIEGWAWRCPEKKHMSNTLIILPAASVVEAGGN